MPMAIIALRLLGPRSPVMTIARISPGKANMMSTHAHGSPCRSDRRREAVIHADRRADDEGDQHGDDADLQRDARPVDDARQGIPAQFVRAHRVRAARAQEAFAILRGGRVRRDQGREDGDEHRDEG